MNPLRRILVMAEMHGRDLTRRHVALGLLVALPLAFYLAAGRSGDSAISAGGIGMAFAVSGATLFSILSSLEVDQRLVLGGSPAAKREAARQRADGGDGEAILPVIKSTPQSLLTHPPRPRKKKRRTS